MDEQERQELLREHLDTILCEHNFYNFLNKWGFNDGADLVEEERQIIEELIDNIAANAPEIEGFIPFALQTACHNPAYIAFRKEGEEGFYRYAELGDALVNMKVRKVLEPIINQEILKLRKKLNLD